MFATIINKLKEILSDRKVTIAILLIVILSRAIKLIYFYNIVVDASYQVMGAQSLLDGHGVSIPNVVYDNLSATIYTPLINWPPGYSILFAPFYYLFNYNYIAAGITLDILSAIALIFVCRSILKVLDTPLYLRNLFTLLTGFFIYYFYFNACSDAIAITLLLIALYFALVLLKTKANLIKNTSGLTFFLFASASLKYLFMPIVFVIPVFILMKGFADREKILKQAGLFSFIALAILISSLLFYQKNISGSVGYISATGRGFYPENLLGAYPVFPASFLKPDTIPLLSNNKAATEKVVFNIYQGIYIVTLLLLITGFTRQLFKNGFKKLTAWQSFFYLSFFLSLSIIILLVILSLQVEKETIFSWWLWTYIEEARYHGLVNVLLHLCVFVFYQYYCYKKKPFLKYIFYFFILFMIPEMLRGAFFDFNRIRNRNKEEYSWQYENRFQKYADNLIKKEKQKNPSVEIIVTGTSYNMNHRVVINSHVPPLTDFRKLKNPLTINTKEPSLLFIMLEKDSLSSYQPLLSQKNLKTTGDFDNFNFYTLYVEPH
jgi:hypothetical protein